MQPILWDIAAWSATLIGGACLLYALAVKRWAILRKTKRRCRKCWYDLSHTDGLQCPECGREWKRESTLYTGKRRGLAVVSAIPLLLGAPLLHRADAIRAHGWVGGVPDAVLIRLAPRYVGSVADFIDHFMVTSLGVQRPMDWREELEFELLRRSELAPDSFSSSEHSTLVDVLLDDLDAHTEVAPRDVPYSVVEILNQRWMNERLTPAQMERIIHRLLDVQVNVAPEWPVDTLAAAHIMLASPVRVGSLRVTLHSSASSVPRAQQVVPVFVRDGWSNVHSHTDPFGEPEHWLTLGVVTSDFARQTFSMEFETKRGNSWVSIARIPLDVAITVRSAESPMLEAVRSPAVESALRGSLIIALDAPPWVVRDEPAPPEVRLPSAALIQALFDAECDRFAAHLVLTRNGRIVAEQTVCGAPWKRPIPTPARTPRLPNIRSSVLLEFHPDFKPTISFKAEPGDVLTITSDRNAALRHRPLGRMWSGHVEIEITEHGLFTNNSDPVLLRQLD